ncbi:MAG: hypothetical protein QME12_05820 [Nanoarchaeota archaeon]|nr:hypothetical protein [Nanoarchaeota archaeon]
MTQKTLDRLLDEILEKATSEWVNLCLHRKPYRVEGHNSKYDPLFEDIAGYAIRMEGYDVFVLETSVKMDYGEKIRYAGVSFSNDKGRRMCLTLRKGNRKCLRRINSFGKGSF